MRDKTKTFWFGIKATACILAVPLVPILFFVGCSYICPPEPTHYYKIQRLNYNGEVVQNYYSKSYPRGTDSYVTFKEFPTGALIKMHASYVAEDLGTNKPVINE